MRTRERRLAARDSRSLIAIAIQMSAQNTDRQTTRIGARTYNAPGYCSRVRMTFMRLSILAFAACLLSGCATIGPIEVSGDPAALPPFATFRIHEEQFAFATDISRGATRTE